MSADALVREVASFAHEHVRDADLLRGALAVLDAHHDAHRIGVAPGRKDTRERDHGALRTLCAQPGAVGDAGRALSFACLWLLHGQGHQWRGVIRAIAWARAHLRTGITVSEGLGSRADEYERAVGVEVSALAAAGLSLEGDHGQ